LQQQTLAIAPDDEKAWVCVGRQFSPSPDFINLENGYFGMPALPVRQALRRYQDEVDAETGYFLRERWPGRFESVMASLAAFTGVAREELLITRNAMESFNILIQGYPFADGDAVVFAQHDYDSVIDTLSMVGRRKGLDLVRVNVPLEPGDDDAIVALYERALTSRTRLLLLTHLVHRTGRIMPVARIAAMARARGVDVIVDAAHSLGQLDYRVPDLGTQFATFNLHKWVGAPLGVGLLYVAKERIADIEALFGVMPDAHARGDIARLGHFSVLPPAPIMAVEDALAFHYALGARNKEGRLRYLTRYWTERARAIPGVRVYTPRDPQRYGALGAFGIAGMPATDVVRRLMDEHRIFTVARGLGGDDDAACVRVTPHLYTASADLDALLAALRVLAADT
jgi:selenocysteine lyase/cysteine desulfurase